MSGPALAQKRPLLLAALAAALAYFYLRAGPWPELWLIPLKGAATALLGLFVWLQHKSPDARLLAWALGAAALGDMAMEADRTIGALLFFAHHVLALGLYLRNRRAALPLAHKAMAAALLLLTPLIAWFMPADRAVAPNLALYALALGAMAAGAWGSVFPRLQVGAGAVLLVFADVLLFAETGPLMGSDLPHVFSWPLYFLGQFLIVTGVVQSLWKREPELRIVDRKDNPRERTRP